MNDFQFWRDAEEAGDVVLPEQRAIAVFANCKGCLIIRQQADWNDDEDSLIFVQPEHAERVARALLNWAAEVRNEQPAEIHEPERRPKPLSNAERQRRFRDNQKIKEAGLEFVCTYCGDTEGPFHIDHVIPRSRGGTDEPENLVTACRLCNLER